MSSPKRPISAVDGCEQGDAAKHMKVEDPVQEEVFVTLRVVSLNCANAGNDEERPVGVTDENGDPVLEPDGKQLRRMVPRDGYRFGSRIARIIAFLQHLRSHGGLHVVCLQEVRRCLNQDGTRVMTVQEVINFFATQLGMLALSAPCNQQSDCMWRVTLYDPEVLLCLESKAMWTGTHKIVPGGPQKSQNILRSTFVTKSACEWDAQTFVRGCIFDVYNVHAPFMEQNDGSPGRISYCQDIIDAVKKRCEAERIPSFVIGDMNPLLDMHGPTQLELLRGVFRDHSQESGVTQTFHSYPHDCNPATGAPFKSNLDMVFSYPQCLEISVHVESRDVTRYPDGIVTEDLGEHTGTIPLSDHFPQIVTVKFSGVSLD